MKLAVASTHDANYRDFAQTTLHSNHKEYCDRHGYDLVVEEVDYTKNLGFEQWRFLLDNISKYDWIWFVGSDTLVMNHNIKIEDKIDNNYHFIISLDENGPNAHSFLVRNSPQGKEWLEFVWNMRFSPYINHCWADNKVVHDYYNQSPWSNYIKPQEQRYMNSYLYKEVWNRGDETNPHEGQFQEGDWLLHMPGTELETRMWIVQNWKDKVIK